MAQKLDETIFTYFITNWFCINSNKSALMVIG